MPFSVNRNRLTYGLDLANSTGIEIGPLVSPIVTRDQSNVKYVDRASTEDLREWYSRDEKINVDDIMNIDYIWGGQSLAEATGGTQQFDYCIASHVIEHIPDLITWLGEISSILKTSGVACFAVPDKRYTFDYLRAVTQPADIVDNYLNKIRKPSYRHIYDHFSNFVDLDISTAWQDDFDGKSLKPKKTPAQTYQACLDAMNNDKYIDSHCSVFTEDSFFDLLGTIAELGLLDFKIRRNFSTKPGMFEFFVQLEKLDTQLSNEDKHAAYADSLEAMKSTRLEINFSSNKSCTPTLYYDTGQGFNEIETLKLEYQSPNQLETLEFSLPQVDDIKLRFDPTDCEAKVQISDVHYFVEGQQQTIELDAFSPLHDIAKTKVKRNTLYAQTSRGATDRAFLLNF